MLMDRRRNRYIPTEPPTLEEIKKALKALSNASKVLSRILINRIQEGVESSLRKEEAGFLAGRGTIYQIFTLRNIQRMECKSILSIFTPCINIEKTFDSIHRNSLSIIMRCYGIQKKTGPDGQDPL